MVYRITCECSKIYIGKTGRPIQDRIKEHERDLRLHPNNINRDSGIEILEAWMPLIKRRNNRRTVHQQSAKDTVH